MLLVRHLHLRVFRLFFYLKTQLKKHKFYKLCLLLNFSSLIITGSIPPIRLALWFSNDATLFKEVPELLISY